MARILYSLLTYDRSKTENHTREATRAKELRQRRPSQVKVLQLHPNGMEWGVVFSMPATSALWVPESKFKNLRGSVSKEIIHYKAQYDNASSTGAVGQSVRGWRCSVMGTARGGKGVRKIRRFKRPKKIITEGIWKKKEKKTNPKSPTPQRSNLKRPNPI